MIIFLHPNFALVESRKKDFVGEKLKIYAYLTK